MMLQDVPNAVYVFGYVDASWTLGATSTAVAMVRLLRYMRKHGYTSATPRVSPEEERSLIVRSPMQLSSNYVRRAQDALPKAGDRAPWRPRATYFSDFWTARFGDITQNIEFAKVST